MFCTSAWPCLECKESFNWDYTYLAHFELLLIFSEKNLVMWSSVLIVRVASSVTRALWATVMAKKSSIFFIPLRVVSHRRQCAEGSSSMPPCLLPWQEEGYTVSRWVSNKCAIRRSLSLVTTAKSTMDSTLVPTDCRMGWNKSAHHPMHRCCCALSSSSRLMM